jgi:hypothetical protein
MTAEMPREYSQAYIERLWRLFIAAPGIDTRDASEK